MINGEEYDPLDEPQEHEEEPEEVDPSFNPFEGEDMFKEKLIQERDEITVHHKNDGTIEVYRYSDTEEVRNSKLSGISGKDVAQMKKDDILKHITWGIRDVAPRIKNVLEPAFDKAALVAKDLSINPKYRGQDITITIQGNDGKILKRTTGDNTDKGYKENVPASKPDYIRESSGIVVKWKEDKGEVSAWILEDTYALASTLTEYNTKKDDFVWSFDPYGRELTWKERSDMSKILVRAGKDAHFVMESGESSVRASEVLDQYLEEINPNIVTFEEDLGESQAKVISRVLEHQWEGFTTLIATQRWGSLSRIFRIRDKLYNILFSKHLTEVEHIDPTLEPETKEALVMTYGSFAPITNEHIVLLKKVVASAGQVKGSSMVFIKPSKEFSHDEMSLKQKAQVIKEAVPEIAVCMETGLFDIMDAFIWAYNRHYKEIYVVTGSDEVVDINQILEENNGKQTDAGFFDFTKFKVVSYGKHNPDKSPEAQAARNALTNGDFQSFMKAVQGPDLPYFASIKKLFDILKYELKDKIGLGGV